MRFRRVLAPSRTTEVMRLEAQTLPAPRLCCVTSTSVAGSRRSVHLPALAFPRLTEASSVLTARSLTPRVCDIYPDR
jgi:hypothetical protein